MGRLFFMMLEPFERLLGLEDFLLSGDFFFEPHAFEHYSTRMFYFYLEL